MGSMKKVYNAAKKAARKSSKKKLGSDLKQNYNAIKSITNKVMPKSSATKTKVKADNLDKALNKIMDDYIGIVEAEALSAAQDTAAAAVEKLQNAHPSGSGKYGSWDEYNSGWTATASRKGKAGKVTIHNKTHYQLTHLLEKGHALNHGGRAKAFPHIEPVAKEVEEELVKNIEKAINNN